MLRGSGAGDPLPFPAALPWSGARGPAPRSGRAPRTQLGPSRCGRSAPAAPLAAGGETFRLPSTFPSALGPARGRNVALGGAHALLCPAFPPPGPTAARHCGRRCRDPGGFGAGAALAKSPRAPPPPHIPPWASRPPRFGRGSEQNAASLLTPSSSRAPPSQPRFGEPRGAASTHIHPHGPTASRASVSLSRPAQLRGEQDTSGCGAGTDPTWPCGSSQHRRRR